MRLNMLAILLCFGPALANASMDGSDSIKQDFQTSAKTLPQALQSAGYRQLGDLDLSKYLQAVDGVAVNVKESVAHKQKTGPFTFERDSAEWRRGNIDLAGPVWLKTSLEVKPMLALHENLGATGYKDDDFSCSGAIWILTAPEARNTLTANERAKFEAAAQGACKLAGGTTGVVGGGDGYNVAGKIKLMKASLTSARSARSTAGRDQAIDQLGGSLSTGFEINRKGKVGFEVGPHARHPLLCLEYRPDKSTLKVWVNDQPVQEDARNGWTYDGDKCIQFHGTSVPVGYASSAAMAAHAK